MYPFGWIVKKRKSPANYAMSSGRAGVEVRLLLLTYLGRVHREVRCDIALLRSAVSFRVSLGRLLDVPFLGRHWK